MNEFISGLNQHLEVYAKAKPFDAYVNLFSIVKHELAYCGTVHIKGTQSNEGFLWPEAEQLHFPESYYCKKDALLSRLQYCKNPVGNPVALPSWKALYESHKATECAFDEAMLRFLHQACVLWVTDNHIWIPDSDFRHMNFVHVSGQGLIGGRYNDLHILASRHPNLLKAMDIECEFATVPCCDGPIHPQNKRVCRMKLQETLWRCLRKPH